MSPPASNSDFVLRSGSDEDLAALARLESLAFGFPLDDAEKWVRAVGVGNFQVMVPRDGGSAVAMILPIRMGQCFGGSPVACDGIASVAVLPEARGSGIARTMMQTWLRKAYEEGVALSCLYATTQTLYRQVGFEQAGHSFRIHVALRKGRSEFREAGLTVRPLGRELPDEVREVHRAFVLQHNGPMLRSEYLWRRVLEKHTTRYEGFGVFDAAGQLQGYVYLCQKWEDNSGVLYLSDVAFRTPEAARKIWQFLGDFGAIVEKVHFWGGPHHPLLYLLPQQGFDIENYEYFMSRLVHVQAAFERRTWSPVLATSLVLDLTDPSIPEQSGLWNLTFADGRCSVSRTLAKSSSALKLDVRALASMYTGFMSATQLRQLGVIEGSDAQIAIADAVFAGPTPWNGDTF